jgi:hypothetical protein
MSKKTFKFYKIYDYKSWHDEKCIAKIEIPIEWSMETICFNSEMVTLGYALHTLEKYLSEEITQEYIDTHPKLLEYYTQYYDKPEIKGDFLEGYLFLEDVELENNVLKLVLGN